MSMHCYYKTNTHSTPSSITTVTKQVVPPVKKKMASATPIAIGTRGTVGALVRKEIEYFSNLDLDRPRIRPSHHHHHHHPNWHSFRSLVTSTWKKKKHSHSHRPSNYSGAATRSFLPTLCSVSDVADTNGVVPGFRYRALGDDDDDDLLLDSYNLDL